MRWIRYGFNTSASLKFVHQDLNVLPGGRPFPCNVRHSHGSCRMEDVEHRMLGRGQVGQRRARVPEPDRERIHLSQKGVQSSGGVLSNG